VDDGDGGLARLLGGVTLHGGDEDLATALIRLLAHPLLGGPDAFGDLVVELPLDLAEQLAPGLLLAHARDPLQLLGDAGTLLLDLDPGLLELLLTPGEPLLPLLDIAVALLQPLLALGEALLQACHLAAAFPDLGLGLRAKPVGLLARGEHDRSTLLLGRAPLLVEAGRLDLARRRDAVAEASGIDQAGHGDDHAQPKGNKGQDYDGGVLGVVGRVRWPATSFGAPPGGRRS